MHKVSILEGEAAEYKRLADERSHALEELQAQFDDLNVAQDSLVQQESEAENWAVVREELHRQAEYMRTLEAANTKMTAELAVLRERHASLEVLREQKRELERKVKGAENLRDQNIRLQAELDASRKEREEWCAFYVFSKGQS